jgi:glycosyltransferase involved in cell wall biosynthesis
MKLSVLIPTYNDDCTDLVKRLSQQAADLLGDDWEIVVGDDVSSDRAVVERNNRINSWPHCRYIYKEENEGRAAIRNWLARQAKGQWLLLIDADLTMIDGHYLKKMWEGRLQAPVVCGGYQVMPGSKENLRFRYEASASQSNQAAGRARNPYHDFKVSNTLIRADVYAAHPLDERLKEYGYEDVLMGRQLQQAGVSVIHIDAPVGFSRYEPNSQFVAKTEQGLRTLCRLRHELQDYSTLLNMEQRLRRMKITPLISLVFTVFGKQWHKNLTSSNPSLWRFKAYKLGYFLSLKGGGAHPKA